jgi:hypothetical protein
MQDRGYELPRILLLRTWVNKGKKKRKSRVSNIPAPLL